jgi:hypothetical protein
MSTRTQPDRARGLRAFLPAAAALAVLLAAAPAHGQGTGPLPTVQFAYSNYTVVGGNTAVITVTLTGTATADVTVDYRTVDSNPLSPPNYTPTSGTLTFPLGGATTQSFTVATQSLGQAGPPGTVNLALSNPVNADPGTPFTATLTILNDTQAPINLYITDYNYYLVPGSPDNAVRYAWSAGAMPDSISMTVTDNAGNVVRTLSNMPTTYVPNQSYAEQKWNACADSGAPLTQAASPYQLKLTGLFQGTTVYSSPVTAVVQEWKQFYFSIDDQPGGSEDLVTGVDETTITPSTLQIAIQLGSSSPVFPLYSIVPDTPADTGPPGNSRGCQIYPAYTFYTTPTTPYDIRYAMVLQQQTQVAGGVITTVMDCTRNPWDMDPTQPGRQTQGIWSFGVDPPGSGSSTPSLRGFQEQYQ